MTDFLTILADNGLVTIGNDSGSAKQTFVRDVYNAVKQGDTVVVFAHDANDEIITAAIEAADGSAVVLQSHETKRKGKDKGKPYAAKDIEAALERRNAANLSAPGDTWGTISVGSYMRDASGELVGFVVQ